VSVSAAVIKPSERLIARTFGGEFSFYVLKKMVQTNGTNENNVSKRPIS